jgi:LasA protease
MRSSVRIFTGLVLIAVLASGCSAGSAGVWIPPSAPPGALLAVADLLPAAIPAQVAAAIEPPTQPAPSTEVPALTPQPTEALAVEDPPVEEATVEDRTPSLTPFAPPEADAPILYYAQAADSLPVVAVRFGVDPSEITSPDPLPERAFIDPGQLLVIPRRLEATTLSEKLLPDSEVVFSPSATDLDIAVYLAKAGGKLRSFQEWLKSTGLISGAQAIARIAAEDSINPRLLLSLLEYQSGWVYGQPATQDAIDYPMGFVDPSYKGLTRQLVWAVNQLSIGYYAYREGRLTEIEFKDGSTARLAPDLNAGTAALQYFFAQIYERQGWEAALDVQNGFPALHRQMFGDPWERAKAVEPLFPRGLKQPPLSLPFVRNWLWSYTGGPHGAWEQDGAYAALDFAPGSTESGCVDSSTWATASAAGLVVRSGKGVVVLDLDGDGREQTGWVLVYLHVSTDGKLPVGTWVDQDDVLGRPSCEGGVSTGTHIHIARKYNGEWIPADGPLPFDLGGWEAQAGEHAYKGTLTRGDQTLTACTCSSPETFITRGPNDP